MAKFEIVCTIIRVIPKIIDFILNDSFYNRHIINLQGPLIQQHLDALNNKDYKIVVRDTSGTTNTSINALLGKLA